MCIGDGKNTLVGGRRRKKEKKRRKNSLIKFRVIRVVLTFLNSSMATKLPYHPPMLRAGGLNLKTMFVMKN